jgi:hypothetical protein
MVSPDGTAKGLQAILTESGILTPALKNLKADDTWVKNARVKLREVQYFAFSCTFTQKKHVTRDKATSCSNWRDLVVL